MPMGLSVSARNVSLCPKGLRALLQTWSWADLLRIKALVLGGIFPFPFFSHPSERKLPSPHSGSWEATTVLWALESVLPGGWEGPE